MFSRREILLNRLARFKETTKTHTTFRLFSEPTPPNPQLEIELSRITALEDRSRLSEMVEEFNARFIPCRLEYSTKSTTTISTNIDKETEAMGKLADEFDMSDEFDAACIAADETENPNPILTIKEELIGVFFERWYVDNEEAYMTQLIDLGINAAIESQDIDRMVSIMQEVQQPIWLAFWNKLNELMGHEMEASMIASLVEQSTSASESSLKETVQTILSAKTSLSMT